MTPALLANPARAMGEGGALYFVGDKTVYSSEHRFSFQHRGTGLLAIFTLCCKQVVQWVLRYGMLVDYEG